jgi:hypothetical protein
MDIRIKNEALAIAELLYGAAVCALIVLGMSGAIYKLIGPEGLLDRAFGANRGGEFTMLLVAVAAALAAWALRGRFSRRLQGWIWRATTYVLAVLGALFAARLAMFGTL